MFQGQQRSAEITRVQRKTPQAMLVNQPVEGTRHSPIWPVDASCTCHIHPSILGRPCYTVEDPPKRCPRDMISLQAGAGPSLGPGEAIWSILCSTDQGRECEA